MLNDNDIEPDVILYLETAPDKDTLQSILDKLGLSAREVMRKGESVYKELGLNDPDLTNDQLVDAIVSNPILLERPIVVNGSKAAIGRPPESVLEIM